MAFGFAKLKGMVTGSVSKFSGKTDFLQAVCAAAALIAIADGDIEDEEVAKTLELVTTHPDLSAAFDARQIEQVMNQMLQRAKAGITGKVGLYKEIDDVASDADMAETVFLTALDVANSDGQIEPQEQAVIDKIAAKLRLDPKKYEV